jgi:hypothetical protein
MPAPAPPARQVPTASPAETAETNLTDRTHRTHRTDRTEGDLKSQILSAIRDQNKTFAGMVIAQAQAIELEDASLVFTFAPIHRSSRGELERKKGWIEQLAHSIAGRRMTVVVRESQPASAPAAVESDRRGDGRQAELRERAKAEPEVQAVLDVFGGEIEDVEELDR